MTSTADEPITSSVTSTADEPITGKAKAIRQDSAGSGVPYGQTPPQGGSKCTFLQTASIFY